MELDKETLEAYHRYIEQVERDFTRRVTSNDFFWFDDSPDRRRKVQENKIVVEAAREDGIIDIAGGLVHNWTAAAFIPSSTLEEVLAVTQDYANYDTLHEPIIESELLKSEGKTYHVRLRMKKGVRLATAILDTWSVVNYRRPSEDRAYGISDTDRVQQVENAGEPDEKRLPPGQGSGYLWRADTYSKYMERDGGVYLEFETVGLSRSFPPLLGWIIEPIARGLGKSSARDPLEAIRETILNQSE